MFVARPVEPRPFKSPSPPPSAQPQGLRAKIRGVLGRASHSLANLKTSQSMQFPLPSPRHKIPPPKLATRGSAALMSATRKDVDVALRYLREVLKSSKLEMLPGCTSAVFDAVSSFCPHQDAALQDALVSLLMWTDRFIVPGEEPGPLVKVEEGLKVVDAVEKAVDGHSEPQTSHRAPKHSQSSFHGFGSGNWTSMERVSPPASTDSGFFNEGRDGDTSMTSQQSFNDTTLDQLMVQLNLRQVPKFTPAWDEIEDSDDESGLRVDEEKEEREEKHGKKTCEEEVQKLPDGTEVRRKQTRTVNMQQTSKHVTIRTRGGGCPITSRTFSDGSQHMQDDDDFETTSFFSSSNPLDRLRKQHEERLGNLRSLTAADDAPQSPNEPSQTTKTKTVEQTSEVSQTVGRKSQKNGRLLSNDEAQKVDTTLLNAKQIETFMGDLLLDRKGDGSYEEATVLRRGPKDSLESSSQIPKNKHVVEYMQTFGDKKDVQEDFFRGSTLASYIRLNDNLRCHEEQFRKKLTFEFSSTGGVTATPDFQKLSELLASNTDLDRIRLPSKFVIEEDDEPKAITFPKRAAIMDARGVLESLDATEWLVLRAKEGASAVAQDLRGGPKDALIAHATQPQGSLLYQEAFLATYRTFVTAPELLQKLVKRYLYMSLSEDKDSTRVARHTFSVLVRIVDELCAVELTRELITSVTAFVYRLIRDGNFTFARLLRKRLMERIEQNTKPRLHISEPLKKSPTLFDFRSTAVAAQMTYLDAELFQKIEPAEMLWWAQEQDDKKSPNLAAFTEHFNKVSYWVRSMVIVQHEQRDREKFLNKFTKIMKQLRRMGNFNSYLAILSALDSGPMRRLDWPKSAQELLRDHAQIMDSSHSFKNYRQLLAETTPPCIPYIGLVLQDLTFVHVGNPDLLAPQLCAGQKGLLNFAKRWQQFAILDSIRRFKSWNYTLTREDKIQFFFGNFDTHLSEDETWELSERIKPRSRKFK